MCSLLQEPVRRLGQVVVGQAAGGGFLELEAVVGCCGVADTGTGDATCIGMVHGCDCRCFALRRELLWCAWRGCHVVKRRRMHIQNAENSSS